MSIDEQPMNVFWSGQKSPTSNKYKINYKGTVATASDLPATGNKKGDTYNISEDGSDYIWTGTEWNKFGANVYIGATSTADGIQGLVPPATNAQIYSLLTGGGTWESAEDLGLAFDDEVLHKTGNETIEGVKTFVSTINGSVSGNAGTVNGHSVAADVPANAVFTDTTYTDATTTTAGLMSAADKTKLDSVGSVFLFKGTVADSTALPSSGNTTGDAYVAEDNQHVYVWDGSAWSDIGVFDFIPPATNGQIDALFS